MDQKKRVALATGAAFLLSLASWKVSQSLDTASMMGVSSTAEKELLETEWGKLDGNVLTLSNFKGHPMIVNFWATWCGPCVRELPMLDNFAKVNAPQIQVIALALDEQSKVYKFLGQHPLSIQVAMMGQNKMGLLNSLGNTSGGLPFSLLLDANGHVIAKKLGSLTPELLTDWKKLSAKI